MLCLPGCAGVVIRQFREGYRLRECSTEHKSLAELNELLGDIATYLHRVAFGDQASAASPFVTPFDVTVFQLAARAHRRQPSLDVEISCSTHRISSEMLVEWNAGRGIMRVRRMVEECWPDP